MAINKKTNEVGCGSSHLKSQLLRRKSSSRSRFKTRKGKKFSRSPSQPIVGLGSTQLSSKDRLGGLRF
jgi:hypothetical protein